GVGGHPHIPSDLVWAQLLQGGEIRQSFRNPGHGQPVPLATLRRSRCHTFRRRCSLSHGLMTCRNSLYSFRLTASYMPQNSGVSASRTGAQSEKRASASPSVVGSSSALIWALPVFSGSGIFISTSPS